MSPFHVEATHPCLVPDPRAVPLGVSRLTDQQRIAVLLQAAGLLSLLDRAGWAVPDWSAARIAPDGRLAVPDAAPGRPDRHAQEVLRELLGRLFRYEGSAAFAGKGPARRAARALLDRWFQSLVPITPDEAVAQILDEAPFLWEPAFAQARAALIGELAGEEGGRPWVAGPRFFRLRLLRKGRSAAELRELLAGPEARAGWEGEEEGDPGELAAAGKWRAAVAAWSRRPPMSEEERVDLAEALAALGRSEAALAVLDGLRSVAAEAVRARCQLHLGQLGAVRATLQRVERGSLTPDQADEVSELAEIAARVLANTQKLEQARSWIRRARSLAERAGGSAWLRVGLVAAAAAWDRRDFADMDRWLEDTRPACDEPDLAWRWHHVRALRAEREPDQGAAAVAHVSRALRLGRRRLGRHEAAGLWNDLGLGRAKLGDLPGAERAFLHAARLLEPCDGPRQATLALPNLAEIRLRRGRLAGVQEILERTAAENRRAGNVRGLAQDLELRARFELVLGRPGAALALSREALDLGSDEEVARLLSARALGWLGRAAEAAAELVPGLSLEALEPEERPALRALAGDVEGALREAEGSPFHSLWREALAGEPAPLSAWEALSALEPYRAARLVFDLDMAAPGCVPASWLRSAAAVFRRLGCPALAGRLEARDQGPWQALATYCGRRPGDPEALAQLFAEAGYPGLEDRPGLDVPARALLALATRDRAPREEEPPSEIPERPPVPGGEIVGESPTLRAALERIALLAPGDLPVLVLGESGTGKELAARRIHRLSLRARAPFVAVNCAALPEHLILSDLFGHARGAFTGADRSRQGVFETANGGTVFLDEIGDLPLAVQGVLLRVLQEGEVRPVGETLPRRVNVRVVAATHRDLDALVAEKTFRQDLYYRLRGGSVVLPPLRDRGEDVLLLAERFLFGRGAAPAPRLSRAARARLLGYGWPGNVRELQNVLSVAAALAAGGVIGPEHLELPGAPEAAGGFYHQGMDAQRRRMIVDALEKHGRNLSEIGRQLGMSRQGVSYWMKRLKID
jgi:DNA-binding NtrC family response regulator